MKIASDVQIGANYYAEQRINGVICVRSWLCEGVLNKGRRSFKGRVINKGRRSLIRAESLIRADVLPCKEGVLNKGRRDPM